VPAFYLRIEDSKADFRLYEKRKAGSRGRAFSFSRKRKSQAKEKVLWKKKPREFKMGEGKKKLRASSIKEKGYPKGKT